MLAIRGVFSRSVSSNLFVAMPTRVQANGIPNNGVQVVQKRGDFKIKGAGVNKNSLAMRVYLPFDNCRTLLLMTMSVTLQCPICNFRQFDMYRRGRTQSNLLQDLAPPLTAVAQTTNAQDLWCYADPLDLANQLFSSDWLRNSQTRSGSQSHTPRGNRDREKRIR